MATNSNLTGKRRVFLSSHTARGTRVSWGLMRLQAYHWIIREQNLKLDGFSVLADDEHVAHFEAWQEGYPDEDYNDEPLSFGVRLRVRAEFIAKVCRDAGRPFSVRTVENRFVLKDYQQDPEKSCSYTSIRVWPIDVKSSDH
jgi:hypothetical protein